MTRSYTVELWDHEEQEWSGALAREHLEGPNEGMSWREIGLAIRRLRALGWSSVSMFVAREDTAS